VVLIGSTNEDGSFNLAPMSSAWWVGWRCMLGLARNSKTTENMIRTGECVLNLPSADLVGAVNCLARTTGSNPVPAGKIKRGYRHEKDKFEISGLTRLASETVAAPRAAECPVQIEAKVAHVHEMAQEDEVWRGGHPRARAPGNHDGWSAQPHRSRQMAAADHEFSAVLWADAYEAATLRTRADSGDGLQATGLAAGGLGSTGDHVLRRDQAAAGDQHGGDRDARARLRKAS
jgi:flavin reductase (DIM6/NTAB) family NADH-FMN oxidoreductase RutF